MIIAPTLALWLQQGNLHFRVTISKFFHDKTSEQSLFAGAYDRVVNLRSNCVCTTSSDWAFPVQMMRADERRCSCKTIEVMHILKRNLNNLHSVFSYKRPGDGIIKQNGRDT